MVPNAQDDSDFRANGQFLTTHWSLIARAGQSDSPAAAEALEKLCRAYWFPTYGEVRRRGFAQHDAQDLTQEFFACLLRRNSFAAARQDKGRFRSYLLGALNYFLTDQWHKQRAEKRGGGAPILSLDAIDDGEQRLSNEPTTESTPEKVFDSRWALTLLDRAFSRLRDEYAEEGKAALFDELKPFLAADSGAGGYAEPARKLGMNSSHVAVAVHRMRARFRACVRGEVAETVANPAEVEAEMKHLFG